ncbi:hypothetical protein GCM10007940_41140 [Portibacter lacus]|uniref:Uncharacterized protein n=1 Tax=Portibacter lacus TaxID=1099794 RepID=A0AA37WG49_9BACT|nr:hypothetical protein GCM10007940_41140 [Portibacter lacus]
MTEEIHILTFFVNTRDGRWEEETLETQFVELLKSQRWLQAEAKKWNQSLDFDNEYFFLDNKFVTYLDRKALKSNPRVILQKIINKLKFHSFQEYLKENEFDQIVRKLKVVIFINNAHRRHVITPWSTKEMDIVILYRDPKSEKVTNQYEISHELLHQFGAWDLYYKRGKNQTLESGKEAEKRYPYSIMMKRYQNKEMLNIDEVTAWRIGWNQWDESFNEFDPFLNQEKIKEEAIGIPISGKTNPSNSNKNKKEGNLH